MLPSVRLLRLETNFVYGTFGVLLINTEFFCVTLEPPSLWNQQDVSCIPPGQYICSKVDSDKYGKTFEVLHVPLRDHIIIHPGNVKADTHGCILLAQHKGKLRGDRAVLCSGKTFKDFMGIMEPYMAFALTIKEVW